MLSLPALLLVAASVRAIPLYNGGGQQVPLVQGTLLEEHLSSVPPGFNINLDEKRLIRFSDDAEPVWMTEREKIIAKANGLKFFDVTDEPSWWSFVAKPQSLSVSYGEYDVHDFVKSVIKELSIDGPIENLQKFTSFRTRYYRSETGRQSQQWLLSKISEITTEYASSDVASNIVISEFPHPWGQNTIIAHIGGSSSGENGTVVISAHQDSTNMFPFLPAPGADDDGSGTVTILEAYRSLLVSGFKPIHDVEFHWYSAEEGGLLGSQAVAKDYASRDVPIRAQLQFDMTAWVKQGTREEVGIVTDFVDLKLTDFIKTLVDNYLDIPYVETKCGYACSDHASWRQAGYPSAFGIESAFENSDKNIHSTSDRIDISPEFSFTHILEFSKLAVAYVTEIGGLSK